jgi:GTP cyclohydrolase-4
MEVPAAPRPLRVAVSRVGLTGVSAVIHLGADRRSAQPFPARIECFVDPEPTRSTAEGPRAEEVVRDALRDVLAGAAETRAERLVQHLAERVRERSRAPRAEVTIAARFPERHPAPVSGIPTQEISTLHARAVASERGTRWLLGVSVQGITTSPFAQRALAALARERLAAAGFSEARIAQVLDRVPVATDDQIAVGTLLLGSPDDVALEIDVAALLEIVAGAMSSEIFELMKRSDEGAVVERAHRRPRSADDCVRAMLAGVVERFAHAPDAAFVLAAQDATQTIHRHHVTAERAGQLRDVRRVLRTGAPAAAGTSLSRWLVGS